MINIYYKVYFLFLISPCCCRIATTTTTTTCMEKVTMMRNYYHYYHHPYTQSHPSLLLFLLPNRIRALALSHWRIYFLLLSVSRNNKSRIVRYTYRRQRHGDEGGVQLNPSCSDSPSSTCICGNGTTMTMAFGSILLFLLLLLLSLLLPVHVSASVVRR